MKIFACATILVLAGCSQPHDAALQEVQHGSDCATCHLPQYLAVTNPVHSGHFPQTCGDCHLTTAWVPALAGGHPEANFPIAAGPHQLPCLTCHDASRGSSVMGANTNCIGCHTGEHVQAVVDPSHGGVASYAWNPSVPNFCLTCHPDGRAAKHPEAIFPISRGNHANIACGDCHDKTLGPSTGGQNTNCYRCHPKTPNLDSHHTGNANYANYGPSMPNYCANSRCHPSGRT